MATVFADMRRALENPTTTNINTLKNILRRLEESGRNVNGSFSKKMKNMIKLKENPYTTTTNRSLSVLRNNRPQQPQRLNLPRNMPKPNKLELYLKNAGPSKLRVVVARGYNANLNQNTKSFTAKYVVNGKNAGNATITVLAGNGDVYFAGGQTNKDFRGRGIGSALRAVLTKAALKAGYNKVVHSGVNKEHRSKFRPGGDKNTATSTWIVTKQLGFTPSDEGSVFRKNNDQSKINNVLRKAGLRV